MPQIGLTPNVCQPHTSDDIAKIVGYNTVCENIRIVGRGKHEIEAIVNRQTLKEVVNVEVFRLWSAFHT